MIRRATVALLLALLAVSALAPAVRAGTVTMTVDGRPFDLVQPEGATGPLPLILALSGVGGTADRMQRDLPLTGTEAAVPFRVAYLTATGFQAASGKRIIAWNDGVCCGTGIRPDSDDSAYLADVVDHLAALGLIGTGRTVAVVGHSNGAQMGYRFTCEHGERVFALVAISGGRAEQGCTGLQGLRVLNINGTADTRYPVTGGVNPFDPRIVHDSPKAAGQSLAAAGASFRLDLVPGARHSMASIDRRLATTTGSGLAATVLDFIFTE